MTPYCQDWESDKRASPLCYRKAIYFVWSIETDRWEARCRRHALNPVAAIGSQPYQITGMVES